MSTPNFKIKVPVPFPAAVVGTGGMLVQKNKGVWTIEPDFGALALLTPTAILDATSKQVWVFDPITGIYNTMTLAGVGQMLYQATSTTSLAIAPGSVTFATQTGKDFTPGFFVLATSNANPANFMLGQVTAYANGSLTMTVPANGIGGSGTHADWTLNFSGPPGAQGASAGYSYGWSTSTAGDPGSGNVAQNNATFASVTALNISTTTFDAVSLATEIATWGTGSSAIKGRIKIYDPMLPAHYSTYDVTAVTNNTTYYTVTVTPVAQGTAFSGTESLRVVFTPKGDKGDTGAPGSGTVSGGVAHAVAITSSASAITSVATVGTAGRVLVDQGASADPSFQAVSGDATLSSSGALTIAAGVVTFAKIAAAAIAAAGDFIGNTASKLLTAAAVWSDAAPVAIADSATYTPNFSTGMNFALTLGSTCGTTGTLANPAGTVKPGQTGCIVFVQDATGGRKIATWGTQYKFPGGVKPTFSSTANAIDTMSYWCKSATEIHCFFNNTMG